MADLVINTKTGPLEYHNFWSQYNIKDALAGLKGY